MNREFYNKIKKMRYDFPETIVDPIEILSKLVPKPKSVFKLPIIKYDETYKIIMNLKLSNAAGFDDITSRVVKLVPKTTAMMMTHLINAIITEAKYPDILKVCCILPILKPNKESN